MSSSGSTATTSPAPARVADARSSRAGRGGRRGRGCRRRRVTMALRDAAARAGSRRRCRPHGPWRSRRGRCACRRGRSAACAPARSSIRWRQPTAARAACQRCVVGRDAGAVVVEVADAGVGDVEGAVGELRELDRALDQAEHLVADSGTGSRAASRLMRDSSSRACAGSSRGRCGASRPSPRSMAACAAARVVAPQLDADRRAHDGFVAVVPAALRRGNDAPAAPSAPLARLPNVKPKNDKTHSLFVMRAHLPALRAPNLRQKLANRDDLTTGRTRNRGRRVAACDQMFQMRADAAGADLPAGRPCRRRQDCVQRANSVTQFAGQRRAVDQAVRIGHLLRR